MLQPKGNQYMTPGKKNAFDSAKRYDGGIKMKGGPQTTGHKSKINSNGLNSGGDLTPSDRHQKLKN